MSRRSKHWNQDLAEDLRDESFARQFLLATVEEGVPLQKAIAKVARAMGVTEFAKKVRMASPNLLRVLNPQHNPTHQTLNRLLRPFKLKLGLAPIPQIGQRKPRRGIMMPPSPKSSNGSR
jgi:DNA-binding phage protein